MNSNKKYIELAANGNYFRLEPLAYERTASGEYYDDNWVRTKISVKGGSFSGQYEVSMLTEEFEYLQKGFLLLDKNLNGGLEFTDMESNVTLTIKGDGFGHFTADVTANDCGGQPYSRLTFEITFDQTYIKPIIAQLDSITKEFPVISTNKK
jgi:hypothetical protein